MKEQLVISKGKDDIFVNTKHMTSTTIWIVKIYNSC